MGVVRAGEELRQYRTRLGKTRNAALYKSDVFPDIQTRAASLAESLARIREQNPGKGIDLSFDVFGYFGGRMRSLPGQLHHNALGKGQGVGHVDSTVRRLLKKEITMMAKSLDAFLPLPDDRITFFFDNPAWVTGEKADTWLKRALAKRLDKKRYDAALTALRTCPERSRETHLDTIRKTAYAVSQQPSYDFSGAGWPQLSNSIAIEEGPVDLPEEATSVDVRAAYIAHNQPLLARDGPKIRFILCQDEADVSIYRYTAETPPTSISVVVSPDSDFDFIPRATAIPYKLHMERSSKVDKRRPWVTTNNVSLQAFAPMWVWEDHAAAVIATLLNGQDYS